MHLNLHLTLYAKFSNDALIKVSMQLKRFCDTSFLRKRVSDENTLTCFFNLFLWPHLYQYQYIERESN